MEELVISQPTQGTIACCECGTPIAPNAANMCNACVRSKVDITAGIPKQSQLYSCRNCERYLIPPNSWTLAKLESKELLSICLKRIKPSLSRVKLVNAAFLWTEPHSKRVKVKLTVQQEVFVSAILQQSFVVEYILYNQMCDECRRVEAKDYWRACVQVRQKCDFKKTLFYMEQLILKHNAQAQTTNVKPGPTGIDFYFSKQQDARKLVEFLSALLPCKYQYSQQLMTHDTKNNIYDYKHTFCVDLVPITRDCLICLPRHVAQQLGNMGQFVLCLRITNIVSLIDPATLQMSEVTSTAYWKEPFEILCQPKAMVEFYVLEVEEIDDVGRPAGHAHVSKRHTLVDVWVVRSNQVGASNAQKYYCRTHLGRYLQPGDTVLGYDLLNSNLNNATFDAVKTDRVPDAVLVRKSYDRARRMRHRKWKLKRLYDHVETASVQDEFIGFMEDLEEDPLMRDKINIYKDASKAPRLRNADSMATTTVDDDDLPESPSLAEMLDDLDLNSNVEMRDECDEDGQDEGQAQDNGLGTAEVEMRTYLVPMSGGGGMSRPAASDQIADGDVDEFADLALQAIMYDNETLLSDLLRENIAAANFRAEGGLTMLQHAVLRRRVGCIEKLLSAGADPDAYGAVSKTPLQMAAETDEPAVVEALICGGADLFRCDANGHTALQLAQINGRTKVAVALLAAIERHYTKTAELRTRLCAACVDGNRTVVADVLAQAPANARTRVLNGEQRGAVDEKSALYIACEHGRVECVAELLTVGEHSIIHTSTRDSVLHAAIASQNTRTVEMILQKFPYLMDAANGDGSLPLHWACRCGNLEVIRTLMEAEYPRDEMKLFETSGPAGAAPWCYQFVCDINAVDAECRTPLYLAAADGHAVVTQYLVDYKIRVLSISDALSVSSAGTSGTATAQEEFAQQYPTGTLDALAVDEADVTKSWRRPVQLDVYSRGGRIALMAACANGYVDVVRILLSGGSDVNLPIALTDVEISALKPMEEARCSGSGALVEAAKIGSIELVRLLFAAGAFDYENQALAVVISIGHCDLVPLFLCQLTFRDTECRINKNVQRLTSGGTLTSITGSLMSLGQPNAFGNAISTTGFPTVACQLNWHNATLNELRLEWLHSVAIYFNPRTRPRELSLFALTRIDLSKNRLSAVPNILFQLPSLRVLNLEKNVISSIDLRITEPIDKQTSELQLCPVLEELILEGNQLVDLPPQLFAEKHFPALRTLNVSGNRLTALPAELWLAPRLRELNAAGNRIDGLRTRVSRRDAATVERSQRQYYQRRHQSSQNFQRRLQLYQQQKQLFQRQLPPDGAAPVTKNDDDRTILEATGTRESVSSQSQRSIDEKRLSRREGSRTSPQTWTSGRRSSTDDSGGDRTRSKSATIKTIVREADVIRVNIWQKQIELSNIGNDDDDDRTLPAGGAQSRRDSPDPNSIRENFVSSLRVLNLSGNQLKQVPVCLACCCPRLTRLDLSANQIESLGVVECLPATLRHLNLANNRLTKCFQSTTVDGDDAWHLICNAPATTGAIDEAVGGDATTIYMARRPAAGHNFAASRHSRSRSKSVARNQRSLSVIRGDPSVTTTAGDSMRARPSDGFEPCAHKSHCRLEALKTLNLSNNVLTSLELLAPLASGCRSITAEQFNWKEHGQQMRAYLIFPALTMLNVSENRLKALPSSVSLLSYLTVLNVSSNPLLESLPAELGLLEKLWNVDAKSCAALGEPLRGVVDQPNYKTSELLAVLRNKLENSKLYPKLKLMILGGQKVGKTSLLRQLRQEGHFSKKALHSESWSMRMGHSPAKGVPSISSSANSSKFSSSAASPLVDVAEWSYEPRKKSSSRSSVAAEGMEYSGSVTFRTWDFIGMTKELSAIQQYFFTRRCLYLVVWKVTEGEIALAEIHEHLLAIQARSPNATVVIVGTHLDALKENSHRFPNEYLTELDATIQERFVGVSDADKKGLPRVVAALYLSTRSRDDARALAALLYQAAVEMRPAANRRQRTLGERWPAAFLALEKIVVRVIDELRGRGAEPLLTFDDFWVMAATQMIEDFGQPFRDILEFRQACQFLHENGVIVYFDDTSLQDFVFLDPPWLCQFLRTALLGTERERTSELGTAVSADPLVDEQRMYATLKFALRQFGAAARLPTGGDGEVATKFWLFRNCFLSLLGKFELALPCLNSSLLLAPLLPDEYLLRADYPGAKVRVQAKLHKWQLRRQPSPNGSTAVRRRRRRANDAVATSQAPLSPIRNYLAQRQIVRRSLATQRASASASIDRSINRGRAADEVEPPNAVDTSQPCGSNCTQKTAVDSRSDATNQSKISMRRKPEKNLRRLYVLQYLPPGFWARLTTRLLDDESVGATISRLFVLTPDPSSDFLELVGGSVKSEAKLMHNLTEAFNRMSVFVGPEAVNEEPEEAETSFIVLPSSGLTMKSRATVAPPPAIRRATEGFEWLLWRTGLERMLQLFQVRAFGSWLFSLAEFLPLADVRDANYSLCDLARLADDGTWKTLRQDANQFIIEILIGHTEFEFTLENHVYRLEIDSCMAAKLLATVVNILDDLLEDWFPALGTRFVHTSEGRLLVDRLVPCHLCATEAIAQPDQRSKGDDLDNSNADLDKIVDKIVDKNNAETLARTSQLLQPKRIYLFSIEECILQGRRQARTANNLAGDLLTISTNSATKRPISDRTDGNSDISSSSSDNFVCPQHSNVSLSLPAMAPDVLFIDLDDSFVVAPADVRRGQLVGRGAFGFVFNGLIRQQRADGYAEVALKVLEPVDPSASQMATSMVSIAVNSASDDFAKPPTARRAGGGQRVSARAAFEAFRLKWQNDTLEHAAHAYCTVRQELRVLTGLQHAYVTALVGFCVAPMTLIVELAPHGALDAVLKRYRSAGARLALGSLQQTCVQIARALEYLHANRIIYRDLKSENVLVWRFPAPHAADRPLDGLLLPSASILPIPSTLTASQTGDVHLKLGDYGISRTSHPGGVCKGYGGTEGFMAPEVMRYSGEQPYTDRVDSYSFGMFLYELISLRQPYEGLDQMKEFILEGRRPYISEKELLYPSAVLDLMVVCWNESPTSRPTASQLVGVCGAPEFARLMDVAILDEKPVEESEESHANSNNLKKLKRHSNDVNASKAKMNTVTVPNDNPNAIRSSESLKNTVMATVVVAEEYLSQCWFIAPGHATNDGRICALTASQFGWTERRLIEGGGLPAPFQVDAFCQVDANEVWLAVADGIVQVYSTRTFKLLGKFMPARFIQSISRRSSADVPNIEPKRLAEELDSQKTSRRKTIPSKNSNQKEASKMLSKESHNSDSSIRSLEDQPSWHRIKNIQPYTERSLVVMALGHHVLVLRLPPAPSDEFGVPNNSDESFVPPILIDAIEMTEDCEIFNLAVLESADEWQIWTIHAAGRMIVHHINGFTDRLIFSTSVRHFAAESNSTSNPVRFVVSCFSGKPLVWTCLKDDSRIFQWRASPPLSIHRTLNCAKILPGSESLSSMNSAVIRDVRITAMQLLTLAAPTAGGEKLIVGTNHGVVIVVDAEQMLPLSSFRPHSTAVEQILVCSDARTAAMLAEDSAPPSTAAASILPYAERRHSSVAGTARRELIQMRDALGESGENPTVMPGQVPKWRLPTALRSRFSPRSTGPTIAQSSSSYALPAAAGELAGAVARGVKDMLSSPGAKDPISASNISGPVEEATFVTIGYDYRCLLNRFLVAESDTLSSEDGDLSRKQIYALFWRCDDWTAK